mgnify:CR=1 FL=1
MKRLLFVLSLVCIGPLLMAQAKDFRSPGYKGSLSLTDQMGVFAGVETSHGFMLNRSVYLGAGAGAFMFPNGSDYPAFAHAFLDYGAYVLDRKSTPFSGLKAGFMHAVGFGKKVGGFEHSYTFENGLFFEPSFGWNWMFKSGYGFTIAASADIIVPVGKNKGVSPNMVIPKVSFTFEF